MTKRLAFLILPGAPDEAFELLSSKKTEEEFIRAVAEARDKGWVEILGVTDKDPKDIVACLQEFYTVKHIEGKGE